MSTRRRRSHSGEGRRGYWALQVPLLVAVIAPVIALSAIAYDWANDRMIEDVLERRQSIARVSAATLRGRFDRFGSIGESFMSASAFRLAVAESRWQDALDMLDDLPREIPMIDRVFLMDPSLRIVADTHSAVGADRSGELGKWATAAKETGSPQVTDVYARREALSANVFGVIIPMMNGEPGRREKHLGFMLIEIRTDVAEGWRSSIDAGLDGLAFIVDGSGRVAAHPKYPSQGEIVDLREDPAVQRLRKGESGVEVFGASADDRGTITAFERVPGTDWGVVIGQPVASAQAGFSDRLEWIFYILGGAIAANMLMALWILRLVRAIGDAYGEEKALIESAGDGFIALDGEGRIVKMNHRAEEMLGWIFEELRGKPFGEEVILQDDAGKTVPLTFRPFTYALKVGERRATSVTPTYYYLRKDGSRFPVAITATPVRKQGAIAGVVVMFRDITAEKEVDRAKSEFVSLASHQLLSPLSAIKGYSAMLEEKTIKASPAEQERIKIAISQLIERMITLVEALLNVSRIELGTFTVEPVPTDLRAIADEVLVEIDGELKRKRIMVERQYHDDIPEIDLDPDLIRIVLQNILTNAVRYSPEGTVVRVGIERRPAFLFVTVQDQGIGIPAHQQEKIFEKFFRADNARKLFSDGNGLGLYIVRSIVDHSGGRIWFTSDPGKGTTFKMTFPLEGMERREGSKKLGTGA